MVLLLHRREQGQPGGPPQVLQPPAQISGPTSAMDIDTNASINQIESSELAQEAHEKQSLLNHDDHNSFKSYNSGLMGYGNGMDSLSGSYRSGIN